MDKDNCYYLTMKLASTMRKVGEIGLPLSIALDCSGTSRNTRIYHYDKINEGFSDFDEYPISYHMIESALEQHFTSTLSVVAEAISRINRQSKENNETVLRSILSLLGGELYVRLHHNQIIRWVG